MPRPFVIGLTGGIGCGKSAAMRVLAGLGAEGIDADRVAHEVMAPGGPAYDGVVAEFGRDILTPGGEIDRQALGRGVFADAPALARLERIVHPAVASAIRTSVGASTAPAVVIEAIKLLEAGLSRALCDEVWVVSCSPETQRERLAATRGMPPEEVDRRRAAQMPQAEMAAQANRVLNTDGTLAGTGAQALAGWVQAGLPLPAPLVRAASSDDAPAMAEILKALAAEGRATARRSLFEADGEAAFLQQMPPRSRMAVALFGNVLAGFQTIEPWGGYSHKVDDVAIVGTYVLPAVRGRGAGLALSRETWGFARATGYAQIVSNVDELIYEVLSGGPDESVARVLG